MSLQTSYRPTSFNQILGNEETVKAIRSNLKREDHNHCILLTGNSGCGKTTAAYIIGQFLGAYNPETNVNPDFREINASDFKGIDMYRMVRTESSAMPLSGNNRVFFLDEAHKLTTDAQEAFLTLMEKASGTCNYYIFATSEPQKFKDTFKRRCAQYEFTPLSHELIVAVLNEVAIQEGLEAPEELGEVYEQIATDCLGSPGIALGIFEAVIGLPPKQMLKAAKQTAERQNAVIDLCRAIMNKKGSWSAVKDVLKGLQKENAVSIQQAILGYANSVMLNKDDPAAFIVLDAFCQYNIYTGLPGITYACRMVFDEVKNSK